MGAEWWRRTLAAAALGAVLLLAGVVLGAVPVSADGLRCGSAWHSSTAMRADGLAVDIYYSQGGAPGAPDIEADAQRYADCRQAQSDRRVPVDTLAIVGAVLLAAAGASVVIRRAAARP